MTGGERPAPAALSSDGGGPVPLVRNLHKLLMLASTIARMGLGFLTFIILARYLGPQGFGVVATAMAYSGFIALVSDFGLGMSALRQASAAPAASGPIIREALLGKAMLTIALSLAAGIAAIVLLPPGWLLVYGLIHLGSVAYSFGELMLIVPRAARRFEVEAKLVLAINVIMLVLAGVPVALTGSATVAAAAFAASRLLYLAIVTFVIRRELAADWSWPSLAEASARLKGSAGYAADGILTTLSAQIDLLLFGALLTAHDIGIYQAGARLVQVIMPFAGVLSTVYLPTLAAAAIAGDDDAFRRNARRLNYEFAALAVVGGLCFAFLGPVVTKLLYGSRYDALLPLWFGFGAFVILRFAAASYGIQLAALGYIRTRIAAQLASIALFAGSTALLLPGGGLDRTSLLLAISATPLLVVLGAAVTRDARASKGMLPSMAITLAVAVWLMIGQW